MTLSAFKLATHQLAIALLGADARAVISLLGSPVMSAAQPQLTFRIGLACEGKTTENILGMLTERALVRSANQHWSALNLGMVHFVRNSIAPSAQAGVVVFDVRMQPTTYDHDA